MPTGYTSILKDGSNPTFKDFAMRCARAFGALISMRDDPLDKEIPEEFKPCNHHRNALEKAKASLIAVKNMTEEECLKRATKEKDKEVKHCREYVKKQNEILVNYTVMCAHVKAWTPPTKDHTELKKFMLEQLQVSWPSVEAESAIVDVNKWKETEIKRLEEDIEYHIIENKKEIERAKKRTEWVKQLRKSL